MSTWTDKIRVDSNARIREHDQLRRQRPARAGRTMPELDELAIGESRSFQMAVLSIDIRGFTKISLQLNNQGIGTLARLQALYLREMSAIIRDFGGVTEKYTGDGVLGLFGTESETDVLSDVGNAVKAALTVILVVRDVINPYFREKGIPEIGCGIGIDYGPVLVEKVGLRGENQLSLSGPTVSLAAKLQGAARPSQILIGEDVRKRLPSEDLKFIKNPGANVSIGYPAYSYEAIWSE